jgi:hypothetical protein
MITLILQEKYMNLDLMTSKLVLLYMMDKMEIPLTENSILDICTNQNTWLNYMDCKEFIYQLTEANFIYTPEEQVPEPRYTITFEGRSCLDSFFKRIPMSLREEITAYSKANMMHFKRKQEYVSSYEKNADGSYLTTFTIREPLLCQPIFEIKMKIDSRQEAINVTNKWIDKAPEIYESIYDELINDNPTKKVDSENIETNKVDSENIETNKVDNNKINNNESCINLNQEKVNNDNDKNYTENKVNNDKK